jgi:voltage-gated potassium channel
MATSPHTHDRAGRPSLPRRLPRWERTEGEFDDWVAAAMERLDPFMAWLGVIFALVVGYQIAVPLGSAASEAFDLVSWVIWAIFLIELVVDVWLAPNRLHFLRRHWWQVVLVLLPTLRILRFFRLVRLGRAFPAAKVVSSSYRASGTARYMLRSRLAYVGGLGLIIAIAVAEAAYVFERGVHGGAFGSFGDAILWALSAVIALQGDPVPVSVGGRIVMILAFVAGLVLITSLAGTIGAFLIDDRRERADADERRGDGSGAPGPRRA